MIQVEKDLVSSLLSRVAREVGECILDLHAAIYIITAKLLLASLRMISTIIKAA